MADPKDSVPRGTEKGSKRIPPEGSERRKGKERRETVVDRRSGLDRRECPPELRLPDLARRRGAGIRRPEDRRSAEEGELTNEQFEFVMAIEEYKRVNHKPFPTWTEVLGVVKVLGYRKEEPPTPSNEPSE